MLFLAVDEFRLRSASFNGPHTVICVVQHFLPTRLDQVMYKTQIFERKQGGVAFIPSLVPGPRNTFFLKRD